MSTSTDELFWPRCAPHRWPRNTSRSNPTVPNRPPATSRDSSPIFDGKTLAGWEGDPKYWRVENGALVGEITPETIIKSNTFIIWKGGAPADFELKADYRITSGGNSGINYRSVVVPDPVTPTNKFAMRGYQFDIDGANRYTGQNYEEKGRLFHALRGQVTHVVGGRKPIILSTIGDSAALAEFITKDWNCDPSDHPRQHADSHAERAFDECGDR